MANRLEVCVASEWPAWNFRPDQAGTTGAKNLREAQGAVSRRYGSMARFVVAEQSGHYIRADQPDLVITLLRDLLQEIGGWRGGRTVRKVQ